MKKILLTGGSGFIGRNLNECLSQRYTIFAPSHKELDILDFNSLKNYVSENEITEIIHAAVHVPMFNGTEKEFFNDMQMFTNIEKISSQVNKVLYFGSGAEYDKRYDITMVKEEDIGKSIPVSEYGLAKYTMNLIAQKSENIYNLRLFGIFGKYELWKIKFISNLCCKALFDLPLTVRKMTKFDFLHIDDLSPIVSWFLEHEPKYHDYNVCSGHPIELTDIAKIVRNESGKDMPISVLYDERDNDYTADNSRMANEISDIKITSITDAIHKLYNWYSENKINIDYNILKNTR